MSSIEQEKKAIFQLIDSYQTENIELALTLVQQNKVLRKACEERYFPLLSTIDSALKGKLQLLLQVKSRYVKGGYFGQSLVQFYGNLGELGAIRFLLEQPEHAHFSQFHNIQSTSILNQILKLEAQGMIQMRLWKINFLEEENPEKLVLTTNLNRFEHIGSLSLNSFEQLEAFLPFFPQMKLLQELTISNANLIELPFFVKTIGPKLERLTLSNNKLSNLPDWLSEFKRLSMLDLYNNAFEETPTVLKNCSKISYLRLAKNQLKEIKAFLFEMESLEGLNIIENQLQHLHFPKAILATKFRAIYADNNPFESFPTELLALKKLTWISLKNCGLKTIPSEIKALSELTNLHFDDNKIKKLPTEIIELTQLEVLSLNNNPIGIGGIPPLIRKLKRLYHLSLIDTLIKKNSPEHEQLKALLKNKGQLTI